jgi:hypothetical protein
MKMTPRHLRLLASPEGNQTMPAVNKARILVQRAAQTRGSLNNADIVRVDLAAPLLDEEVLAVDMTLQRFTQCEPSAVELLKRCCFVGLTQERPANELGISVATAERTWAFARAGLFRKFQKAEILRLRFPKLR